MTELLCIGNAIVDVFAGAGSQSMDRLGIREPVQHIGREEAERILAELGVRGGSVFPAGGGAPVFSSGGGAANVAKIAALLEVGAAFAGCAGGDGLGDFFREDLRAAGVAALLTRGKEKTGTCIILSSPEGETRIAASPGAALEFTGDDIDEKTIQNTRVLVLDGYVLERRPLVRRVLELADRYGTPVALDTASVFQIREKTGEILQYCRNYPLILFMNADEAIAFYHALRKDREDAEGGRGEKQRDEREKEKIILEDICPVFKILTGAELFPIIVIKLGGRGALALAGGELYRQETFTLVPKNSIGAGDAFCAAFLASWIRGKSLSECLSLGNRVAGAVLEVPGTRIKGGRLKPFAKLLKK
ncbi:MAG: PfkB family carbohydrate kinase [Treponema sp.]|jgi:sugar/nucleoside kinase (ribokinase family)|nr:PfkB family carbohydrate kinase [Treponema sp.]